MRRTTSSLAALAVAAAVLATPTMAQAHDVAPVAGAQTSGDSLFPHQGNGGYDVGHYDVDLHYATTGAITAVTTITATTTGAPLSSYSYDLDGLTVSAVTVNGAAATFSRVADTASTAYKLVVTPTTPVSGAFTTVVTYAGTPAAYTDADGSKEGWNTTAQGVVGVNEPIGAMTYFPNNNTPSDKATFVTHVSVPTAPVAPLQLAAVSNGVLTSTVANADSTTTYTWTEANPMTSYLQLLAIGRYTKSESDIDVGGGKTVHAWNYVDAGSTADATTLGNLPAVLQDIGTLYGTYPGTAAGVLVSTSSLGYALETQDRPYFERTLDQDTMIHEYVHQWFGDNVSPADWNDVWLNEGPAEFTTAQVKADLFAGASTEDTYYDSWNTTAATDAKWTIPTARMTNQSDLFGWQVYQRGAMTLEALRTAIGDTDFFALMKAYQSTYGHGSASSAQFIALAEQISGHDLTAFFHDWIYDADKPAWPSRFGLSLTSSPVTGTDVAPGDTVTYTLAAANTGKVAMTDSVVEASIPAALDVDPSTLPAGLTLSGSTLTWAVPSTATGATSTVAFDAVAGSSDVDTPATVTARATSLGGTCSACASTVTVTPAALSPVGTPTITGAARVGVTLTGRPGTWADGSTLTYQWLRDGAPIASATRTTYPLVPADLGHAITLRVTGRKSGSATAVATSAARTVALGRQRLQPVPTIAGQLVVGQVLRARPGTHDSGTAVSYRWYVGKKLSTVHGPAFKLTDATRHHRIHVVVTSSKKAYVQVVKASKRTGFVHRR